MCKCMQIDCENDAVLCTMHPYAHNPFDDVIEFHRAMVPDQVDLKSSFPSSKIEQLRVDLINEEIRETIDAIKDSKVTLDIAKIADGICDSIVVLIGTALAYGIPIQECWDEVHRTNMAKIGGPVREDGKRLKPEGWTPPNLEEIIEAHSA